MIKSDTLRSIVIEDLQDKMEKASAIKVDRKTAVRFLKWLDRTPRALDNVAADFWHNPNPNDHTSPIAFEDLTMAFLIDVEGYSEAGERKQVNAEAYLLPDWQSLAEDFGITARLTEEQVEAVAEEIIDEGWQDGVTLRLGETIRAVRKIMANVAEARISA